MEPILDEKINDNPHNYQPCFNCEETSYTKVTYTWWGGLLGPKLLHHVKCNVCGSHYNGKTGKSNGITITAYITFFVILLIIFFIIFLT